MCFIFRGLWDVVCFPWLPHPGCGVAASSAEGFSGIGQIRGGKMGIPHGRLYAGVAHPVLDHRHADTVASKPGVTRHLV